jgi:hypothetical protein
VDEEEVGPMPSPSPNGMAVDPDDVTRVPGAADESASERSGNDPGTVAEVPTVPLEQLKNDRRNGGTVGTVVSSPSKKEKESVDGEGGGPAESTCSSARPVAAFVQTVPTVDTVPSTENPAQEAERLGGTASHSVHRRPFQAMRDDSKVDHTDEADRCASQAQPNSPGPSAGASTKSNGNMTDTELAALIEAFEATSPEDRALADQRARAADFDRECKYRALEVPAYVADLLDMV